MLAKVLRLKTRSRKYSHIWSRRAAKWLLPGREEMARQACSPASEDCHLDSTDRRVSFSEVGEIMGPGGERCFGSFCPIAMVEEGMAFLFSEMSHREGQTRIIISSGKTVFKMVPMVWRLPLSTAVCILNVSRRTCKLAACRIIPVCWCLAVPTWFYNLHCSESNVGPHSCHQLASAYCNEAPPPQLTPVPSLLYGPLPAPLLSHLLGSGETPGLEQNRAMEVWMPPTPIGLSKWNDFIHETTWVHCHSLATFSVFRTVLYSLRSFHSSSAINSLALYSFL